MKILLVEDQKDKQHKLVSFLEFEIGPNAEVFVEESLRGGLKYLLLNSDSIDLIILDMSMPNFGPEDLSGVDYSPESFAGKDLMEQMALRDITIPVIVVTQYSSFQEGSVSLSELSSTFSALFPDIYIGAVYYNAALDSWKDELRKHLL